MSLSHIIRSLALLLIPTNFIRCLCILFNPDSLKIGKNCHIGFSYIDCDKLVLVDNSRIGHFNFIHLNRLEIGGGKIMHFNFIKGGFSLIMECNSWMHSQNKITSDWQSSDKPRLMKIGNNSAIISNHIIDVTDSISIGEGSLLAGSRSQIWTHSFYLGKERSACVMGEVTIGNRCYIGANAVICAGVHICDNVAIGAGTTVAKDINKPGLYVSQPLRYIDYNADYAIDQLGEPIIKGDYRYRKLK